MQSRADQMMTLMGGATPSNAKDTPLPAFVPAGGVDKPLTRSFSQSLIY